MVLHDISVITCTSDRPVAFELCKRWMGRQLFVGWVQWIIADDGEIAADASADVFPMCSTRHLRLTPKGSPKESFRHNMLAALECVSTDKILIVEDDDWYHEGYVGMMAGLLDIRPLVGGMHARYYNVAERRWKLHTNGHHASLCTTGFRAELLPTVRKILLESGRERPEKPQQLDGSLWKRSGIPANRKLLLPESPHVVGIKGMPGKGGLGIDHRPEELKGYADDPDLSKLREWIGDDADAYSGLGPAPRNDATVDRQSTLTSNRGGRDSPA